MDKIAHIIRSKPFHPFMGHRDRDCEVDPGTGGEMSSVTLNLQGVIKPSEPIENLVFFRRGVKRHWMVVPEALWHRQYPPRLVAKIVGYEGGLRIKRWRDKRIRRQQKLG